MIRFYCINCGARSEPVDLSFDPEDSAEDLLRDYPSLGWETSDHCPHLNEDLAVEEVYHGAKT